MPPPADDTTDPARQAPRVFLVDDDTRLRETVRELLVEDGIQVVGEAGDAVGAVQAIPGVARGGRLVVLMDVRVRHEALVDRVEVKRLCRWAVAAVW